MINIGKYKIKEKYILIIAFIIVFIIRILYVLLFKDPEFIYKGDNLQYLRFAENILDQGLFAPDLVRQGIYFGILGPGYSLIISGCLYLFGHNYIPIFILNALFSSLVILILYWLTKEITDNNKLALFILVWGMYYINYFRYTPFLLKESLVYLLLPLTILLLISEIKNHKKISWNIILLTITYTYLIHTDERYFFYFPFIIIFFFFFYKINYRLFIKKQMIFTVGVLLIMTPWLIRNYAVYDQVVILTERTTKITSIFWGGDLTKTFKKDTGSTTENVVSLQDLPNKNSLQNNHELALKDHSNTEKRAEGKPYKFGPKEKYLKAMINFWRPTYFKTIYINDGLREQHWSIFHNLTSILFYGIFLPFYLAGILYLIIRNRNILLLFIASIPIIHMLIHVGLVHVLERYRSPVDCFVVIIAVYFLQIIISRIKPKLAVKKQ